MKFPYAPQVVRTYLAAELAPIRVATEVPNPRPAQLVTITTAPAGPSGVDSDGLSWRRLIIRCWDSGELATGRLAETVREAVWTARYAKIGVRDVRMVGEPADWRTPDDLGTPRFQMTVDVLLRKHIPDD